MGFFRFRRTIKVAPGVRLNVGKTGISTTVGVDGARVTTGNLDLRLAAIETLAAIGPPAGSALPALRLLGADRDPVIREAARYALARIGEAEAQR